MNLLDCLNDLEASLADNDDRDVEEYRDRYPEHVAAIDALRAVVTECESRELRGITYTYHVDLLDIIKEALSL